jgi:hypothetical protein
VGSWDIIREARRQLLDGANGLTCSGGANSQWFEHRQLVGLANANEKPPLNRETL